MSDAVKPVRVYDSSRRKAQAKQTRRAIIEAARELFLELGYGGTTMAAIARSAGVSPETVYKAFQNKPGLVKAVFDVSIGGDDEPVPMLQRDRVAKMRAEPDPRKKVLMYGEHLAEAGLRAARLQLLIRSAAASDPEASTLWSQMLDERLAGMSELARHLHEGGHLREDVSHEEARDVLWTYNSIELYDLLVLHRGWDPHRYGRWVAKGMIAALLPNSTPQW